VSVKRYFHPAMAPHNLPERREDPLDTEYVLGEDYDRLAQAFDQGMLEWQNERIKELEEAMRLAIFFIDRESPQAARDELEKVQP
jgi:hypothetical protein